jgi:hypothetical protein
MSYTPERTRASNQSQTYTDLKKSPNPLSEQDETEYWKRKALEVHN